MDFQVMEFDGFATSLLNAEQTLRKECLVHIAVFHQAICEHEIAIRNVAERRVNELTIALQNESVEDDRMKTQYQIDIWSKYQRPLYWSMTVDRQVELIRIVFGLSSISQRKMSNILDTLGWREDRTSNRAIKYPESIHPEIGKGGSLDQAIMAFKDPRLAKLMADVPDLADMMLTRWNAGQVLRLNAALEANTAPAPAPSRRQGRL